MKNHKKSKTKVYTMEEAEKLMNWSDEEWKEIKADAKFRRIAYEIRELREKEGLTQEQLAKKANLPRTTITKIESGNRNVTIDTLMTIAESTGKEVTITFSKK